MTAWLCAHGLHVGGLHCLQTLLVMLLGKTHVPQHLGSPPHLRDSFVIRLSDAVSVLFSGLVMCGMHLGLVHVCTISQSSQNWFIFVFICSIGD